jgi:putative DNA primase/helicase
MTEAAKMFEPLGSDEMSSLTPSTYNTEIGLKVISPVPTVVQFKVPQHNLGDPSDLWKYLDEQGNLLFAVARFDRPDGKKEIIPLTYGENEYGRRWHWKGFPSPRPLYNLDKLAAMPDAPVLIVEGEKTVEAAARIFSDFVVTTSQGGCGAASMTDWAPLKGRNIVIWPDADDSGMKYQGEVLSYIQDISSASLAAVVVPEDFPVGWDLADTPPKDWDVKLLRGLLQSAVPYDAAASISTTQDRPPSDFSLREDGVYMRTQFNDGRENWEWFCSRLEVAADTRDANSEEWGRLLIVTDRDNCRHEWAMPMKLLGGEGGAYRERLLSLGLELSPGRAAKNALHEYISTTRPEVAARCVSRIGWHDRCFVLPDATYGETGDERVLLQTANSGDTAFRASGSLEEWQEKVSLLCVGNSRLVLAVSAALAPPLLYIAGEESGGFHFAGQSRTGKTTTLRVAGSVWGGGGINGHMKTWRATANGLEAIAAQHCDACLCLDEMGQVDAKEAGEVAYMLANGSGKSRSQRDGSARPTVQWRLLFLSTGEISLADKMIESGKRARAGQEVRLADIPADAEAGLGIFEQLHGFESADYFARHLREATENNYGTPSRAFLEKLTVLERDKLCDALAQGRNQFIGEFVPKNADGQVSSVAGRFALVAAAGELATKLGITGWPEGTAINAAAKCFLDWMKRRGGSGAAEYRDGITQIRKFLEAHGTSRFEPMGADSCADEQEVRTYNRAGFRRRDDQGRWEYLVLPETFKTELCAGFNPSALTRELKRLGLLIPDKIEGKPQSRHKLPGMGTKRVYYLSADIMESDNV